MRLRLPLFVASAAVLWTALPSAQAPQPAQSGQLDRLVDRLVLDSATVTLGDVTADGRWIVATTGSLRGRIGIDNSRFGDPTYTAPSLVDVSVIDATTGAAQKIFADRRQVGGRRQPPRVPPPRQGRVRADAVGTVHRRGESHRGSPRKGGRGLRRARMVEGRRRSAVRRAARGLARGREEKVRRRDQRRGD